MKKLELSAVICTRNRAEWLEDCLIALLNQDVSRQRFEIVVVNNGSTDGTDALCAKYAKDGVRQIHDPIVGLSHARNTAIAHTSAPLIAYLDDDARAEPCWVSSVLSCFLGVQPIPGWVGGPVELVWPESRPIWLDDRIQESLGALDYGQDARWLKANERLVGCNSCFLREALERTGGFNTRLGRIRHLLLSGEETELQRRLEREGYGLYYDPRVKMRHAVSLDRMKPSFFYRRFYWGGVTDAMILRILRRMEEVPLMLPGSPEADSNHTVSRLARFAGHFFGASGLLGQRRKVAGRTYLSYAAGYLAGSVRGIEP